MTGLQTFALSVRQPWAWAIVYAGKDYENRPSGMVNRCSRYARQRLMIHASGGLTRAEYSWARDCMEHEIGIKNVPAPADLIRGAFIGDVMFDACDYGDSESPWVLSDSNSGLMFSDPVPYATPIPAFGMLGIFKGARAHPDLLAAPLAPKPWMKKYKHWDEEKS